MPLFSLFLLPKNIFSGVSVLYCKAQFEYHCTSQAFLKSQNFFLSLSQQSRLCFHSCLPPLEGVLSGMDWFELIRGSPELSSVSLTDYL